MVRVGYRAKAVALATKMGLVGLVQNRPDGHVLMIAEGERAELERFAAAIIYKNEILPGRSSTRQAFSSLF